MIKTLEQLSINIGQYMSSLLGLQSLIAGCTLVAILIKSPVLKDILFPTMSTTAVQHGWLSKLLNWFFLCVFLVTTSKLTLQQSSGSDAYPTESITLLLCYVSLTYLYGYFNFSVMQNNIVGNLNEQYSGRTYHFIPLLVYVALASLVVLRLEDSLLVTAVIGITVTIMGVVLHNLGYIGKALKRDSSDFSSILLGTTRILSNNDSVLTSNRVHQSVLDYNKLYAGIQTDVGSISSKDSIRKRKENYHSMVSNFYDLVTDFYEYGWGQSFHFAPRFVGETFKESIIRSEHYLASKLGLAKGMRALDLGCGVGGPLRNIVRLTEARVEGITINQYQVKVANRYNKNQCLDHLGNVVQGDFMDLPWEEGTFDSVYAIESTCHSPDKKKTFEQVFRVLKEGGDFVGYEWCMLNKYEPDNKTHVKLKEGIEVGNGLPTLATDVEIIEALQAAGFQVLDHHDMNGQAHQKNQIPWYDPLTGKMSLSGFRMTKLGRMCTHALVSTLELVKIAPKGSAMVNRLLNITAEDLVAAGRMEIFTPDYFFHVRKPVRTT